jgi:hypothetical protein
VDDLLRLESIFLRALEQGSSANLAAFLDRECDAEMRPHVERLLSAHPKAGRFLEEGPPNLPSTSDDAPPTAPGTRVGPYKLLQPIGEGGMGSVWMAEQTKPVRRMVALKLIKPGMDSAHVLARFEAERQALALMDHPNIARFRDAEVLVAGDLLWHPVEGRPDVHAALDAAFVFGRPNGHRKNYNQWEEANVPVTVAFDIVSPREPILDTLDRLAFCDEHGVEEYYLLDPVKNQMTIRLRQGSALRRIRQAEVYVSPRLGILFDLSGPELVVCGSDGERIRSIAVG